jgi:predicted dehydrogenase
MKTVGMGLVGPGFIATHHLDAIRRLGDVDIVAIAGSSLEAGECKARQWGAKRGYGHYEDLVADADVHVVHNTTPNHLHFEVTMAALRARKHVISDKPLAMTLEQSRQLRDAALSAGVAHVVVFNYRGNPLVQEARSMIADGQLGNLVFVHGYYLQDWMTDENVYSWRSDPIKGGTSSALADIGSHWCDLAEHVAGSTIKAVLADLTTVVPVRSSSGTSVEPFAANAPGGRERIAVPGEDLATVLLRFENGAKGCFSVGQVLPGHKNDLRLELNGRSASLEWNQERQNRLWIGRHDRPSSLIVKDPLFLSTEARRYAHLPAGHQEGWGDAFRNVIADAYEWIRHGGAPAARPLATATFTDGYRSSCMVDAMLNSHAAGGVWTAVNLAPVPNGEDT